MPVHPTMSVPATTPACTYLPTVSSTCDIPDPSMPPPPVTKPTSTVLLPMNAGMALLPWPIETDLVFAGGSNTLMLTIQRPLVRLVIRDAFENLRATILLEDAFPNAGVSLTFIRESLIAGAKAHLPGSADILQRIKRDMAYQAKIVPLVRSCCF